MAQAFNASGFFELDVNPIRESFGRASNAEAVEEDEEELLREAITRLSSQKGKNTAIMRNHSDGSVTEEIDVRKLNRQKRELVVNRALATNDQDNFNLLAAIKERIERVGLKHANVEVRFENLNVVAKAQSVSRALPTLKNSVRDVIEMGLSKLKILRPSKRRVTILNNVSGVVKPGRMTLLLGPPGSGKSTLLKALSGKLDDDLMVSGNITYNGYDLNEFFVQRTSAYISQTDSHIGDLTVRETLDLAARWQGARHGYAEYMNDLIRLEKERNIRPKPEIDAFMTAHAGKHSVSTEYVLKVLGLDKCSDTNMGNEMVRGVSGGQRKRVTTGEMIVGPRKTLFMDEISTGLDSATTFQIVRCVGNFVHQMEATVLMALLQPPPETFDLFDDLILLADGYVVYHGPKDEVLQFFESLGFRSPQRKGIADFLQEVTSRKDQEQYWADPSTPYRFVSVPEFAQAFKESRFGRALGTYLSVPFDRKKCHPRALSETKYAVSSWEIFKTCCERELLLIKKNRFLYTFRTCQIAVVGFVTSTMFLRTRLHPTDENNGSLYESCLFYSVVHMMFNGFSELTLLISRLPVFYKQRDNLFYPAWAFSLSSFLLRVPYSVVESVVWSLVVYYAVGLAPSPGRFIRYILLLFSVHQMALGLFRAMASVARDMVVANTFASASLLVVFVLGGFIIPRAYVKKWWAWAYWVSPLTYGQRAISVNEFTADRWKKKSLINNETVGINVLLQQSLPTDDSWYWIGLGALLGYAILFNIIVTLALAYLNPIQKTRAVARDEPANDNYSGEIYDPESCTRQGMILPFQPLTMTFQNVSYYIDTPPAVSENGVTEKRLKLLCDISGVFSPGVLTALVGSSGAGKTTLMDVLAGRKTGGYVEGDIRISGYPKEHASFARVSGYVEQSDIHSPQVTVEESLWFSASLRLPKEISKQQRKEFVEEVMHLVELHKLRQALVGLPGTSGLSTEQRKRLTIAVELVSNPSIIFMDEPTSGLDARAAAIVMRTVRNTVNTGRTVVCTIHQPSIEIFEAFDELLLIKTGGRVIYGGKLGVQSRNMIDYFERIPGIPPLPVGHNPATWVLEVTTPATEEKIGKDLADEYLASQQLKEVEESIKIFNSVREKLSFSSQFAQDFPTQFRLCLWKQNIVYWRSPPYNSVRICFTTVAAVIIGSVFWNIGSNRDSTQAVFMVMGALYSASLFIGISNATTVQPIISVERTVFYRERAAGMYSPLAYAAAQGLIELPYLMLQTVIYGAITYYMIGFERTAEKFILYLMFMFLTFTYFTCYGMMAVGLTPSQHMAAIVSSAFYSLWNLFSGFLIPLPKIAGWWLWMYYLSPVAWTLRGIITSQLGDVDTVINSPTFVGTVKEYLSDRLGYGPGMIGPSALVLLAFCTLFFGAFAASLRYLNFQNR